MDCLPNMGSTGFDPIIGIIALLLLGLGAAAVVIARRKKGAAIAATLPLLLGVLIFGGLASTGPAQAACVAPTATSTPPPTVCVDNPDLESYFAEDYTWYSESGEGATWDYLELRPEDAARLFSWPEPPAGTASIVAYLDDDTELVIPLADDEWQIYDGDGTVYLDVLSSVIEIDGVGPIYWRSFVYTVATEGYCDSTFELYGGPQPG